jgi:hypothetical protein
MPIKLVPTSRCRACGAEIMFAPSAATGKLIPINIQPEKRIVFVDAALGVIQDGPTGKAKVVSTFISHFATCPNAANFRKGAPANA